MGTGNIVFSKIVTATGVKVDLSSVLGSYTGDNVIDGMYESVWNRELWRYESLAHTKNENSPYLQIDLGTMRRFKGVKIWNRNLPGIYIWDTIIALLMLLHEACFQAANFNLAPMLP